MKSKKTLKKIEIEMLKVFINICKKENLQYFVLGGTALGAVRHKGFIPWDDDIDIALPRGDYEKFITVAQKYLPEYYFLQNNFSDKNCPLNFSKIRDSRTTFIETSCQNIKMNHGVYIDIFPLDGYPTQKFNNSFFKLADTLLKTRIDIIFSLPKSKKLKLKIVRFLLRIIIPNYRTAVKLRNNLLKKYKYSECDYISNFCGAWGERETMPKSIFGTGVAGMFEELEVNLPNNVHQYLTNLYGDYMCLPPIEKRVAHHYTTIIDLKNPYTKYI